MYRVLRIAQSALHFNSWWDTGDFGPHSLEIVTDNGPQYVGQPCEDMCCRWNINHTTTSRQVRTVKGILKKCKKTGNDVQLALLHRRCTPIDTSVASPSETLFNCPIRTNLPSHHPTLQNQQVTNEGIQQQQGISHGKLPQPRCRTLADPTTCQSEGENTG